MYNSFLKPLFDFIFAVLILLILSPIFLLVWLCLTIVNNGKSFFYQRRPGKGEKIFTIVKFKTMTDSRASSGKLLPDAQRLTAIGSFVRKTSLDELPQLLNVLKGDMSFVGPRPLLPEYLPLYNDRQRKRHNVKPGITGLAQVNGRNAISWEQKFEYDIWYVENQSFALDLKILFKTVQKVFKSEGIAQEGQVTAERFTGTK
ncbi:MULTISPECIES: sugar transferase [Aequorivita]|uniref:Sugar transferase n=1 Tax=Aequorivita iocasae TaxID=2803865 RepID=A0ABX7DQS0_9FLAO|nr:MULTISPECIES: sugar transferase [Aequorivita]QQX75961.1 sugar transferase [Aequorivita iocasae]UCA55422.1 sugar transferase [Aequorivita sp. F7]